MARQRIRELQPGRRAAGCGEGQRDRDGAGGARGYPVLRIGTDGVTVILDEVLLHEQYGIRYPV
jgi:hypothetical protein